MNSKGWLLAALAACMAAAAAGPANAQIMTPEEAGYNYSVTLGAALMVGNNLNDDSSPMIGFSWYGPAGPAFGNNAVFGLSADWLRVNRNDGSDVQMIPLLFNYRQYGVISNYRVFVNFGVGILATTDPIPEMQLEDGANFGWTGGLGLDISNSLFLQARFIGSSNPGDDGLVSVQLGLRF